MKVLALIPITFITAACTTTPTTAIIQVDFENKAYQAGTSYDEPAQKQDWTLAGGTTRMDTQTEITDQHAASGARSLKVSYPAGRQDVKQAAWVLPGRKSYHLRYKVKFAEDFDFNGAASAASGKNGGKLPGLAARPVKQGQALCTGGAACDPGAGFSARLMWRTNGVGVLYLYDLTKSRTGQRWGEDIAFSRDTKFMPGQWHTIDQFVKLNTTGKANGQIRVWLDNKLMVNVSDREIIGGEEKVDTLLFSTFFGGNTVDWYPKSPQTAYFDDFEIWPDLPKSLP